MVLSVFEVGAIGLMVPGAGLVDAGFLVLAAVGLFVAGVVKGASGLGYSSCALPFLAAAVGLKTAIVLVVIPAMVSNIAVTWTAGHFMETVRRFWPFYVATLPGIWIGIQSLAVVDQRSAEIVLGLLIATYAVIALARPPVSMPATYERPLQWPAGLMNGYFTGLTGSQVLPLLPYMMALKLDAARMVQAVNLSVIVASAFMAIALMSSGLMTLPGAGMSIAAIVPAMAGIAVGVRIRKQLPLAHYRTVVLVILGLLGVGLVLR
jgi:uncharacterized membrane protein YfcA